MNDAANNHGEDPRFKRRRSLPDPRGALAVIAVLAAFSLQFYLIYLGSASDMPPWVVGLVSSIVAFYYGQKTGNGGGGTGGVGGAGGGTGGPGGPGSVGGAGKNDKGIQG